MFSSVCSIKIVPIIQVLLMILIVKIQMKPIVTINLILLVMNQIPQLVKQMKLKLAL